MALEEAYATIAHTKLLFVLYVKDIDSTGRRGEHPAAARIMYGYIPRYYTMRVLSTMKCSLS